MKERMNKPFVILLVVAVIIGTGIGGIFAGGVAFGKSSGADAPTSLSLGGPRPNGTDGGRQFDQGQFGPGQGGRTQQGLPQGQPGQFNPPPAVVPPTQEMSPDNAPGQSFSGRGGLTGTIEKVEGNLVTVTTAEGPVEVTIAEATSISQISQASVDDLQAGLQVTVMGPPAEDGSVEAANVVITPEGMESFFGRGQLRDRSFRRGSGTP